MKAVFIAATGQNVGKTTICLGLIAALRKRFSSVGFTKPVGQQHVRANRDLLVDKDAHLFKEHFELEAKWEQMSPVIIPSGFTRDYLDGKIDTKLCEEKIIRSFKAISKENPFTIVEGTGHIGVGSIVGLSNAFVASALGLEMVIIASGGLGSALDELALNIALCKEYGVKVRGVILNRVYPEKKKMIDAYIQKALFRYDIPLIGSVPFSRFLSSPTMSDFEQLFATKLLTGKMHALRHFRKMRLVSGSVSAYYEEMEKNQLIITPTSRLDIIHATIEGHRKHLEQEGIDFESGMILTGRREPPEEILRQIRQADIPILYAPIESFDAMSKITHLVAKTRVNDKPKIARIVDLVEENVNLDFIAAI